jgi:hypothetical protein
MAASCSLMVPDDFSGCDEVVINVKHAIQSFK